MTTLVGYRNGEGSLLAQIENVVPFDAMISMADAVFVSPLVVFDKVELHDPEDGTVLYSVSDDVDFEDDVDETFYDPYLGQDFFEPCEDEPW